MYIHTRTTSIEQQSYNCYCGPHLSLSLFEYIIFSKQYLISLYGHKVCKEQENNVPVISTEPVNIAKGCPKRVDQKSKSTKTVAA